MVEPFDPHKIPVLMVHGLWSSPMTWMEMFNDLLAYPEIRSNYQFWFYLYPTGEPFWVSANQMRSELAKVRQTFDPQGDNRVFDQMVLVGHSMGGLVSMMQTIDSGNDFWQIVSEHPFDELQADPEVREEIAQTVFFEPNPSVHEVITIGTPHRGSTFANEYTRYLARKLIRLPSRMLWVTQRLILENPGFFRDTDLLTISTSIDSLAADSPIFPAMLAAKRAAVGPLSQYRGRRARGFVPAPFLGARRWRGGFRQCTPRGLPVGNRRGRRPHDRPRASARDPGSPSDPVGSPGRDASGARSRRPAVRGWSIPDHSGQCCAARSVPQRRELRSEALSGR